jgi:hypothetical protein
MPKEAEEAGIDRTSLEEPGNPRVDVSVASAEAATGGDAAVAHTRVATIRLDISRSFTDRPSLSASAKIYHLIFARPSAIVCRPRSTPESLFSEVVRPAVC